MCKLQEYRRWFSGWLGLWWWIVASASVWAVPAAASDIQWSRCWVRGVEFPARCGVLKRPLDPAAPTGRQIELHVAMLPARSHRSAADPVVFFAGGPGQSAVQLAGTIHTMLSATLERRSIILIDQRGTGQSAPLRCEEDTHPPTTLAAMLQPMASATVQRCLAQLQTLPHGDVRQYTTPIAMADAEAVRAALGVARWNLVGVSYGTRAALEYLRQYPARVRRVVLDGVAPPDMVLPLSAAQDAQDAFEAVLASCEADATCQRQYPNLRQQWHHILAGLPREVSVAHPVTGQPERFTLTRDMLASLVRAPLYVPFLSAGLPLAIDAAAAGRFTPLVGLAAVIGSSNHDSMASGLHFSVVCAEDGPALLQATTTVTSTEGRWATALLEPYRRVCRQWPKGSVPEAFYRVPPAPVATLLLSGSLDPITPPHHAERVQKQLGSWAQHWVLPGLGHGQLGQGCVGEWVDRFFEAADDTTALAISRDSAQRCARARPRPLAALPFNPEAGVAR